MKNIFYILIVTLLVSCGSDLSYDQQIINYKKLTKEAISFKNKKLYQQSIQKCDKAIEISDTLSEAFSIRANSFIELKKYEEAIDNFDEVIDIEGEKSKDYFGKSMAYWYLGKKSDFIENIDTYISFHTNHYEAYWYRSLYNIEDKNYEKAISDLNACIKIKPNEAILYQNRANAFEQLGNKAASIKDNSMCLSLSKSKNNSQTIYKRANLLMSEGRYQEAINDFSKTNYVSAYLYKADCYVQLKKHKEALQDYSSYLKFKPNDYEVIHKRMLINQSLGNTLQAKLDLIKSSKLEWKDSGFLYKYGWVFLLMVVYLFVVVIISATISDENYDSLGSRKAYMYYFFTWIFGGHHIYLGYVFIPILFFLGIFTFLFQNSYYLVSYYDNINMLKETVLDVNNFSWILISILGLLVLDFITMPLQVFMVNTKYRNSIKVENIIARRKDNENIIQTLEENRFLIECFTR